MSEQERARRPSRDEEHTDEVDVEVTEETDEADVEKIDELLDEIDSVLEENAEEFVKNYVQKGGE